MTFNKICLAVLCLGAVFAEPPVNNQYLPPSGGYNYNKPNVPFPPGPSPTRPPVYNAPPSAPAPRPPPVYGPPPPKPPTPTYGPPAPRPPTNTYGPPQGPAPRPPTNTYGPPSGPAPRPPTNTYGPPQGPAPRPPTNTYGPPSGPAPRPPTNTYGPPQGPAPGPKPTYGTPTYNPDQSGNNVHLSDYPGQQHQGHDDHHHHVPGMPFDFNYAVKDDYYGTDYSHNAVSDGDVVRGEYKVLLPDGRLQIVTYTADWKNGFNADVKYQGEPQYPQGPGTGGPGGKAQYGPPPPPSGGGY